MSQDVIVRTEYKTIPVVVQGRKIEPREVEVSELMAGEIADSLESLFTLLGALQAFRQGKPGSGKHDLLRLDPVQLQQMLVGNVRGAILDVVGLASGLDQATLRQLDLPSLFALVTATLTVNAPFFSMLPQLLGLTAAAPKAVLKSQ